MTCKHNRVLHRTLNLHVHSDMYCECCFLANQCYLFEHTPTKHVASSQSLGGGLLCSRFVLCVCVFFFFEESHISCWHHPNKKLLRSWPRTETPTVLLVVAGRSSIRPPHQQAHFLPKCSPRGGAHSSFWECANINIFKKVQTIVI